MSNLPTQLLIRSQDRQNYSSETPSKFRIELSTSIKIPEESDVRLISCMIGNTYYNVNTTNNHITVGGVGYSVPVGNYGLTDFLTALQTILVSGNPNMTVSFNTLTSNITIANSTAFTMDLTQSYMYQLLGFQNQTFSGSTSYTGVYTPTIDNLCLYINLDTGSFIDTSNKYGSKATFVIMNNSNKDGYIIYNCKTQYNSPTRIQGAMPNSINVSLMDSNNNYIQNASEWCMLLEFRTSH